MSELGVKPSIMIASVLYFGVDISQQHSSNDFMNYFTSKINTIGDQTVTMQPPATVSHQSVHYRSPEELFNYYRRGRIV